MVMTVTNLTLAHYPTQLFLSLIETNPNFLLKYLVIGIKQTPQKEKFLQSLLFFLSLSKIPRGVADRI